jgi:hypothetical protein
MEDCVSDTVAEEEKVPETVTVTKKAELKKDLLSAYRLLRRKFFAFFRKYFNNSFTKILFITLENEPKNFILNLQKQYPDKIITVIKPLLVITEDIEQNAEKFEYFAQNKKNTAYLYENPIFEDNIKVIGIYPDGYGVVKKHAELYTIQYIAHFISAVRIAEKKYKAEIIHAENIPYFLGLELGEKYKKNKKILQIFHDTSVYPNIEPFWAAINIADKKSMKKLCKDNIIRKNLISLFKIEDKKDYSKISEGFEYLYKNFDSFRKEITPDMNISENILLKRLNERITKLFPNMIYLRKYQKLYNPMHYSLKRADNKGLHTIPYDKGDTKDCIYLPLKSEINKNDNIIQNFDVTNYRTVKLVNKQYLIKEFSEKRIETKFTDMNLFDDEEVTVSGYIDAFYKAPLLFVPVTDNASDSDIQLVSYAVLKLFEQKKNIQVIFNFPKNFDNGYFKSLLEFFTNQQLLNGRWIAIEGKLNLARFSVASDMILLSSGKLFDIENLLYTALAYGCVPIIKNQGVCGNIVTDIFEDMNNGFGFKSSNIKKNNNDWTEDEVSLEKELYTNTIIRALNFYTFNNSNWKILTKNAIKYDSSWDFETIEKYNNVYEDML